MSAKTEPERPDPKVEAAEIPPLNRAAWVRSLMARTLKWAAADVRSEKLIQSVDVGRDWAAERLEKLARELEQSQ